MKHLITILIFATLYSCTTNKSTIYFNDIEAYRVQPPPGTIEISENFYADETEVRNIDYKEFMYWVEVHYGYNSNEYTSILPDTLVWRTQTYNYELTETYLRAPYFDDKPVVGITYEQALKFSQWRTNRVAELQLRAKKLIKTISKQASTPENHFTIERYLAGGHNWIIKQDEFITPIFTLPTIDEWEYFSGIHAALVDKTDSLLLKNMYKCIDTTYCHATQEELSIRMEENKNKENRHVDTFSPTINVRACSINMNFLYGIVGNVSELTAQQGIVKGGSWKNKVKNLTLHKNINCITAQNWVGFRNIARYQKFSFKNKN